MCLYSLTTRFRVLAGPCASAQRSLMKSKVLDVCSAIMADHFADAFPDDHAMSDEPNPLIMDAKEKTVCLLLSLLEGVNDKVVINRFGDTLDFEVLKARMAHVYRICVEDGTVVTDATTIPEDIYFGDLNEAFAIYMLIATIARHNENAKDALMGANYSKEDVVALEFFMHNTGCIEINWDEKLERVYFPIPPVCSFLTEATIEKVKWTLNRETSGEKVQSFFEYTTEMHTEMVHLEEMSKNKFLAFLSLQSGNMKTIQLIVAVLINGLLLASYEVTIPTHVDNFAELIDQIDYNDPTLKLITQGLMAVLTGISLLIFISMSATFGPLAIKNAWAQRQLQLGKQLQASNQHEFLCAAYRLLCAAYRLLCAAHRFLCAAYRLLV